MSATRVAPCALFSEGEGATRRRRRAGRRRAPPKPPGGGGAAARVPGAHVDARAQGAHWYAVQTLGFGVEEDVARLCAQEDVEALGGLEFHQPRLKQYTRTSKGMLSERRVPVTPGMAMIKFKYSREMMFIIGQSKLFAKFLSRKTTWSSSSMNLKRIEADTDPGEPLTDEEAEWMLRSEERDGGEYVSMTERGGGPAEEVAKVGLETNDLVEVVAEASPFFGFEGHVVEINGDNLVVSLAIFGTDTPMEMPKDAVKQISTKKR